MDRTSAMHNKVMAAVNPEIFSDVVDMLEKGLKVVATRNRKILPREKLVVSGLSFF
jgi:hypothetical protein